MGVDEPPARHPSSRFFALAILGLLTVFRLVLAALQERCALGDAGYDDALFMRLAAEIVSGNWLGSYDHLTLVKAPGYPLWIAGSHRLGLPLSVTEGALYVAGCAVLARAFRPIVPSALARSFFYGLLLFSPVGFGITSLRFNRDAIYVPLTMLAVGFAIGLAARSRGSGSKVAAWSLGLGAALGAVWLVHAESRWILPPLALAYGFLAFDVWQRNGEGAITLLGSVFLVTTLGFAPSLWVAKVNESRYGVAVVAEFRSDEVRASNGALSRPGHAEDRRYVVVSREARERLYPHSPALRELRPFLEGASGAGWRRASHRILKLPMDETRGEILGAWFAWALRDAVARAGHHASAPEAAAFYAQLALEVDAACDSGAVASGPPRRSLLPMFRSSFVWPTLTSSGHNLARLVVLEGLQTSCHSSGPREIQARFAQLSRDRLAPLVALGSPSTRTLAARSRLRFLDALTWVYRIVVGPLVVLSVPLFAVLAWRRRLPLPALVVGVALLAAVGARILMLGYIEATYFNVNIRLVSPAYALALAFLWLSVCMAWFAARRPARARPRAAHEISSATE